VKDDTAFETYRALRSALLDLKDDPSAVMSVLASQPDGGESWFRAAYGELRQALVEGRVTEAEMVGHLLGVVLDIKEEGSQDELADNSIHKEAMRALLDGISSIQSQDNEKGIGRLAAVTEAVYCNDSLRWVAWIWTARAAAADGDVPLARRAAGQALRMSDGIDRQARAVSLTTVSEIDYQAGEALDALERMAEAVAVFEEIEDQRGTVEATLNLARMLVGTDREEDGLKAAYHVHDRYPDLEEPVVFLSQRALQRGLVDEATRLIQPFCQPAPESPEMKLQAYLLDSVRRGALRLEVVAAYLDLRERPPSTEAVLKLEGLVQANPTFPALHELLAWHLARLGRDEEARAHFQALAASPLDRDIQTSALLGLGWLASRRSRKLQPSARVRAAASAGYPTVKPGPAFAPIPAPVAPPPYPAPDEEEDLSVELSIEAEPADESLAEYVAKRPTAPRLTFEPGPDDMGVWPVTNALGDSALSHPAVPGAAAGAKAAGPVTTGEDITAAIRAAQALHRADESPAPASLPQAAPPLAAQTQPIPPATKYRGGGYSPKAAFTGSLQMFAVPDLLEFLRSSRRTGTLVITSEAGIGAVHLYRGMLTGAASPNTANLGDILLKRGLLTRERLSAATEDQKADSLGRLLGAILVERGFISTQDLQTALGEQIRSAILEMVAWTFGRFAFEPDKRDQSELDSEIAVQLDTQAVLLDALREFDERQRQDEA
jgi:hypothetical protein